MCVSFTAQVIHEVAHFFTAGAQIVVGMYGGLFVLPFFWRCAKRILFARLARRLGLLHQSFLVLSDFFFLDLWNGSNKSAVLNVAWEGLSGEVGWLVELFGFTSKGCRCDLWKKFAPHNPRYKAEYQSPFSAHLMLSELVQIMKLLLIWAWFDWCWNLRSKSILTLFTYELKCSWLGWGYLPVSVDMNKSGSSCANTNDHLIPSDCPFEEGERKWVGWFQTWCKEMMLLCKSLGSILWCILCVGNKAVGLMLLWGMQ